MRGPCTRCGKERELDSQGTRVGVDGRLCRACYITLRRPVLHPGPIHALKAENERLRAEAARVWGERDAFRDGLIDTQRLLDVARAEAARLTQERAAFERLTEERNRHHKQSDEWKSAAFKVAHGAYREAVEACAKIAWEYAKSEWGFDGVGTAALIARQIEALLPPAPGRGEERG